MILCRKHTLEFISENYRRKLFFIHESYQWMVRWMLTFFGKMQTNVFTLGCSWTYSNKVDGVSSCKLTVLDFCMPAPLRWQDGAGSITRHLSLIPCCYQKWKMQLNALRKPPPRVLFTILPALNRPSTATRPLSLHLEALLSLGKPTCKLKRSISSSENQSTLL